MWISVKLDKEELKRIEDMKDEMIARYGCRVSRHAVVRRMIREGYNHLCGELNEKRLDGWGVPL